jgi:type III restriction enzyme
MVSAQELGPLKQWCVHDSDYARTHGGKPWQYLLIPHDAISENMTLSWLAERLGVAEG